MNNQSPKKILVVDDDEGVLRLWTRVLEREGFSVTLTRSAEEAIEKLKDNSYSVIFTDFRMPGMGGMELLKYCRAQQIKSCVNIMTGQATVEGAVQCIRSGACDYVGKPFEVNEIIAMSYRCMQHNAQREEIQSLRNSIVKLEELDRLKSDLVSNVSHELRTPLFSLGAAVDLLFEELADKIGPESKDTAQIIQNNIMRLNQIVTNILNFSRIENGTMKPTFAKADIDDLIKKVFSELSPLISKHGLKWVYESDPTPFPNSEIEMDTDQIHQVLVNLLGNAIKFTPREGTVGCRLRQDGDHICLCVWDSGKGISKENLTRVFERFYQVDSSSTREVGGAGIGLSIVRAIVEMHGGRAWFESEVGQGTQCYVRLPIHQKISKGDISNEQ